MKIVQVIVNEDDLFGLDEDGILYQMTEVNLGFGKYMPTWVEYCKPYGGYKTASPVEQVVNFIRAKCYTSTPIIEEVHKHFGPGTKTIKRTETELVLESLDCRATVGVMLLVTEPGEVNPVTAKSIAIRMSDEQGVEIVTLVNRRGGTYERL